MSQISPHSPANFERWDMYFKTKAHFLIQNQDLDIDCHSFCTAFTFGLRLSFYNFLACWIETGLIIKWPKWIYNTFRCEKFARENNGRKSPFPSCLKPLHQSEAWLTYIHMKELTPRLALRTRLKVTRGKGESSLSLSSPRLARRFNHKSTIGVLFQSKTIFFSLFLFRHLLQKKLRNSRSMC